MPCKPANPDTLNQQKKQYPEPANPNTLNQQTNTLNRTSCLQP